MRRLGIAFFFDEEGVVDDYMIYLLRKMAEYCQKILLVSNGELTDVSRHQIIAAGCEVLIRKNTGFDVGAYKAALEHTGYGELQNYDEVILFNHTFFGPLYPLSEMFDAMDARDVDFWGITSHKEMIPNPFTGKGRLPRHINSHFIAVRQRMLKTAEFIGYWQNMPEISSYLESIFLHESKFTEHFSSRGFTFSVYTDDVEYDSHYPSFINVDKTIEDRCPILKRRPFFHDYSFHEEYGIDLPRALKLIRDNTDYDLSLIWKNILRSADLRTLNTNAALTSILPDVRLQTAPKNYGRIAVCAHIYYTDMTAEIMKLTESIPTTFDFIATTDTEEKAAEIRKAISTSSKVTNLIVRVMEINRGRDMSALFIACRDLFLDDRYALVCRLHTKKSPQVDSSRSMLFRRHLEDNLLHSEGYVANVLDMFVDNPWIGLAIPPIVHISYPTLGNSWFTNREKAREVAKSLGLAVKFDDDTPVAAYGTMFWFRPAALRKLFFHKWEWEDFNPEPFHRDGGLAHVLERLIAYAAQDAGFTTQHIMSHDQAARNYVSLEYKLQKIASILGGDFKFQVELLRKWQQSGYPSTQELQPFERGGDSWKEEWWKAERLVYLPTQSSSDTTRGNECAVRKTLAKERGYRRLLTKVRGRTAAFFSDLDRDAETVFDFLLCAPGAHVLSGPRHDIKKVIYAYLLSEGQERKEILHLFDSKYYTQTNPEIRSSGINPLVHFIRTGAAQRRNPHPLFDVSFYLNRYPDVLRSGINPLLHFIRHGGMELRQTHPLFDAGYYSARYPDVIAAGLPPLMHYILYGGREKRDPHPLFSSEYYIQSRRRRGYVSDVNPLVDYIGFGAAVGIDPHPLFDSRFYQELYGELLEDGDPFTDFLQHGAVALRSPHPLFKPDFYVRQEPQLTDRALNPLLHYLENGNTSDRNPHPLFDGAFYLERYPEVAKLRINPLIHFVRWGAGELRDPNPGRRDASQQNESHNVSSFVELVRLEYKRNPGMALDRNLQVEL